MNDICKLLILGSCNYLISYMYEMCRESFFMGRFCDLKYPSKSVCFQISNSHIWAFYIGAASLRRGQTNSSLDRVYM